MNRLRLRLSALARGRYRPAGLALLLFALLGLSRLVESIVIEHNAGNFEAVLDARCAEYLETAEKEFGGIQRSARRVATEVAGHAAVVAVLNGADTSRVRLFETVGRMAREQDVGIEVYDRHGSLLAWEGRSGAAHRREVLIALDGQMTSYVNRTPIASQLFVAIPVRDHRAILGAVIVLRTVDVQYPLNNRYIRREGLTQELTRRLGVSVEFNFAPGAEPRKDGRYASAVLYGIDSTRVGTVSVLRPPRSAFLDGVRAPFRVWNSLLLLGLLGVAFGAAWSAVTRWNPHPLVRFALTTVLIWGARYGLLWIEEGALVPTLSLFDPSLFASQFGAGIARSPGDMTLSVVALVCSVINGLSILIQEWRSGARTASYPKNRALGLAISAVTALLIFWILRGFGAIVRSVVFDSTLRFADPREITPSLELAVMILNLLVTAACVLTAAIVGVRFILRCVAQGREPARGDWLQAAALLCASAWIFGSIPGTPLMSPAYRLVFALLALAGAAMIMPGPAWHLPVLRTGVLLLVASAVLYYPLVDRNVREKDRGRIETFAQEVTRPVDGWMSFVVDDALSGFTADETVDVLAGRDEEEMQRLAFVRWAKSLACREGYTALFAITDPAGREISRFAIGGQISSVLRADTSSTPPRASVQTVYEGGAGGNVGRIYAGAIPIHGYDGEVLGYGRVLIAASQQTLFRGENPKLLRAAGPEDIRSFYRPVSVSEFRDGVVFTTSNAGVPVGYPVPPEALTALGGSGAPAVWVEERIDNRRYETYYVRKAGSPSTIVALGLQEPGAVWHLVGVVKLLSFCAVVMLVLAVAAGTVRRIRGGAILATFRDRLLAALLVTALVPLTLMTVYGRYAARERMMTNMSSRLGEYTSAVVQGLPEDADSLGDVSFAGAEEFAADMGTDFNVYLGAQLALTSRPELFEAGILDRRMSGGAYSAVLLEGKRAYVETERIGAYEYAVGFRPIVDRQGKIGAVVSVPTLYRQDELDAEVSGRSAFLLGVYLAVIASMLAFATTFATRIAAPIHRLTEATKRVARGDLSVQLSGVQAEGEIGELIRSFEQMTADLQQNRENLVRAERELAWKEMARQVAHEIKNPLTPMRLAVQHLRMVFREGVANFGQELDEVTRTLLNQIDTLSRIASEFSHFARMPHPQLASCDLNEVVKESVQLFSGVEGVDLQLHATPGLPFIRADRDELRRAFINVLRNAFQAINNAGAVTITTRTAAGAVEVAVHDSGPGIPEEVKGRLFQPNFSTKSEGMGLGLALVKQTVDALGGKVTIESQAGAGTTVTVRIPVDGNVQREDRVKGKTGEAG